MENKFRTLTDFMADQGDVRRRLIQIMRRKEMSIDKLSKDMGLNKRTLADFLLRGEDIVRHITFFKIENYILQQERQLGIIE